MGRRCGCGSGHWANVFFWSTTGPILTMQDGFAIGHSMATLKHLRDGAPSAGAHLSVRIERTRNGTVAQKRPEGTCSILALALVRGACRQLWPRPLRPVYLQTCR